MTAAKKSSTHAADEAAATIGVEPATEELAQPTATELTPDKATEDAEVAAETAEVVAAKDEVSTKSVAKAGKRSAKALKAAEEQLAKEERKTQATADETEEQVKPKSQAKPTRSKLERRGKKFQEAAKHIEAGKTYSPKEALELATKTSPVRFDASVEIHVNLAVDPRQADQNVRGTLVLPAGTGKTIRIAAFTDDSVTGADIQGVEAITKQLDKGDIQFDILIATPANMPKLGKYARLLGPRGLMPNPKSGTVTNDVAQAISEAKAGRVEYRVDSSGIIHASIGKVSFGGAKLLENFSAIVASLRSNKPASIKGNYIKAIHLTTSMGPSIPVSVSEA